MPLFLLLTLKLYAAGAREAATKEVLVKPAVKKPTSLQIREAEKSAVTEGMQRGNARGIKGWGNTIATAKNEGFGSEQEPRSISTHTRARTYTHTHTHTHTSAIIYLSHFLSLPLSLSLSFRSRCNSTTTTNYHFYLSLAISLSLSDSIYPSS